MSLVDSPGFDQDKNGKFVEPDSPEQRSRKGWIRISVLFIVAIGLGIVNLFATGQGGLVLGHGAIEGKIVDELQQPLQAEVMVLGHPGTVWTDETGYFMLESIPSGSRTLLVGYMHAAQARQVVVNSGSTADLGLLQIRTARRSGMEGIERLEWR